MTKSFPPIRIAVSAMFLLNGFLMGSWAPQIPQLKARLDLTESQLGLMILVFGIGSIMAMPLVGAAISRLGSKTPALWLSIFSGLPLIVVAASHSLWLTIPGIFIMAALLGGTDIAMNANAVGVERKLDRAIMSSCHGFWSLGGVFGAGLGGLLMVRIGDISHAAFAGIFILIGTILAWRFVMVDRPAPDEPREKLQFPRSPWPYLIGLVAFLGMVPEGAVLDWGALYLRDELSADAALSGFAFAAFSATMAIMRFSGDIIRDRFGAVKTMRVSCMFAGLGLLIASLAASPAIAITGFAIAGLGIANLVPIAFSAAGNLPGMAPGIALSVVTFMGYSGILVAPSLIGFIAERTGFSPIFAALALFLIPVFLLAHIVRHADRAR